jgi:uncharacterized protein YegJ (DUF2314 family)
LAAFSTVSQRINLVDEALLEKFREGNAADVMTTLAFDAISPIDSNDARMQAAVQEARDRWAEFATAWTQAEDRSLFIAKFPFTEGDKTEFMWVNVTGIGEHQVEGVLLNKPFRLFKIREGDHVACGLDDLNDWMYPGDDEPVGAFTELIVREAIIRP